MEPGAEAGEVVDDGDRAVVDGGKDAWVDVGEGANAGEHASLTYLDGDPKLLSSLQPPTAPPPDASRWHGGGPLLKAKS